MTGGAAAAAVPEAIPAAEVFGEETQLDEQPSSPGTTAREAAKKRRFDGAVVGEVNCSGALVYYKLGVLHF
jgi:hypothetical protein